MANNNNFTFRFSLTILNHLGRGLYRSFATVIAEAVSNAWDADAECVNISIDIENDELTIWDDGIGMNRKDIEEKFLKIGYTRRENSDRSDTKGRHVLGRKGIGKLAYLSISKEIIITTKKKDGKMIPVRIDNNELDAAINKDEDQQEYRLVSDNADIQGSQISESGTQLIFRGLRKDLRKKNIREILATQFHFTHALKKKDKFEIHVNGTPISTKDLEGLYKNTQFIWFLNEASKKEFMAQMQKDAVKIKFTKQKILNQSFVSGGKKKGIRGYIASVKKPTDLLVTGSKKEFKASVSLFAGGRVRESEIISKITTAKVPENYLFGQIHIDEMDSEDVDRFTSSRDGVLEDDFLYQDFLDFMRSIIKEIMNDWDKWRVAVGDDGDPDNLTMSIVKRNTASLLMSLIRDNIQVRKNKRLIKEIRDLAYINVPSYVLCFIAENLMRIYISKKNIAKDNPDIEKEINDFKGREKQAMAAANILFNVRAELSDKEHNNLNYLGSSTMAAAIDGNESGKDKRNSLTRDIEGQTPIRNALMHTSTLSEKAQESSDLSWSNVIIKTVGFLNKK